MMWALVFLAAFVVLALIATFGLLWLLDIFGTFAPIAA